MTEPEEQPSLGDSKPGFLSVSPAAWKVEETFSYSLSYSEGLCMQGTLQHHLVHPQDYPVRWVLHPFSNAVIEMQKDYANIPKLLGKIAEMGF